jgi:hypothetical protein
MASLNEEPKTIDEFTILSDPSANDLFIIVKNRPGVNLETRSVSLQLLFSNSSANLVVSNAAILSANTIINRNKQTPANSSITVTRGTIMYDDDYLYIATSNNTLKRIGLTAF